MSEHQGMTFPAYGYQEWPRHVVRSDGATMTASGPDEVEAFLHGDADALAAHKAAEVMAEETRKIEATRTAAIAKANADADAALAKLVPAEPAPMPAVDEPAPAKEA